MMNHSARDALATPDTEVYAYGFNHWIAHGILIIGMLGVTGILLRDRVRYAESGLAIFVAILVLWLVLLIYILTSLIQLLRDPYRIELSAEGIRAQHLGMKSVLITWRDVTAAREERSLIRGLPKILRIESKSGELVVVRCDIRKYEQLTRRVTRRA